MHPARSRPKLHRVVREGTAEASVSSQTGAVGKKAFCRAGHLFFFFFENDSFSR